MTAEPAVIDGRPIRDGDGLDLFEAFTGGLLTRALRGSDVEPLAAVGREEDFWPVVAATTFESVDEALGLTRCMGYGVISGAWTKSFDSARTLAEEIHSRQVCVHTCGTGGGEQDAFGGFRKFGYGREKGFGALAAFTWTKSIILEVSR